MVNFAAKKLLGILNENWLGEGEEELSAEQFKSKIKLESISIESDGNFEFWYEDDGLFGGHAIKVGGDFSDGPKDAGIEG
jgi:hypothetical protein